MCEKSPGGGRVSYSKLFVCMYIQYVHTVPRIVQYMLLLLLEKCGRHKAGVESSRVRVERPEKTEKKTGHQVVEEKASKGREGKEGSYIT